MLGEVLILGAGVSGLATLEYLNTQGTSEVSSYTLVGGKESLSLKKLPQTNVDGRIVLGTDEIPDPVRGDLYDIAVVSPGISPYSEIFQAAQKKSKRIISEVELAYLELPIRWIGITGTNGKTTTTTLVAHMLNEMGSFAIAAGNIGLPLTSLMAKFKQDFDEAKKRADCEKSETFYAFPNGRYEAVVTDEKQEGASEEFPDAFPWIVAELSSYQLENTFLFHPKIACLLNVAPDHLAWHKGFENYRSAKAKIFQNLEKTDYCVVDIDDESTLEIARSLQEAGKTVFVVSSRPEEIFVNFFQGKTDASNLKNAAYLDPDTKHLNLALEGAHYDIGEAAAFPLKGEHNVRNMLAALSLVSIATRNTSRFKEMPAQNFADALAKALKSCPALPHRIEEVATIDGVTFVNDSKATNYASTLVALKALSNESKVLLFGGKEKGIELTKDILDALGSECEAIVCFGEAGKRCQAELEVFFEREPGEAGEIQKESKSKNKISASKRPEIYGASNLEEAVSTAEKLAKKLRASCILLSPGFSSFDEFSSFEERGDAFNKIVYGLKNKDTKTQKKTDKPMS